MPENTVATDDHPHGKDTAAALLTRFAIDKLADHAAQIERCANLLTNDQLWYRPNAVSNSIANMILHLCGNLRQWIIGGIGGQTITRDRPAEFAARDPIPTQGLLTQLQETLAAVTDVLTHCDADALSIANTDRPDCLYDIQGYHVTGLAAVMHVVEHFAFHTGQIITTTKWLLNVDLSLYDPQGHRLDDRTQGTP